MEATVAVNFILSYLYNKLPRRRVDMFGEMLEKQLQNTLEQYWLMQYTKEESSYVSTSLENNYYYNFNVGICSTPIDPLLNQIATSCLIDIYEILSYFPEYLTLFIEPGHVQYQMTFNDSFFDIWKSDQRKFQIFDLLKQDLLHPSSSLMSSLTSTTPTTLLSSHQYSLESEKIVSTFEKLSILPKYPTDYQWASPSLSQPLGRSVNVTQKGILTQTSTVPIIQPPVSQMCVQVSSEGCFIQKSSSTPNFTAASFAQTKFGSTKLKSQLKRSSRISNYLAQQRSLAAAAAEPLSSTISPPSCTTTVLTCSKSEMSSSVISKTQSSPSPSSSSGIPTFSSSYFDSPTSMLAQRSISLSPCVRPQRGHSPPYLYNMPLILPPFTSTAEPPIPPTSYPPSTIMSGHTMSPPTIQITKIDTVPITLVVTTTNDNIS